MKTDSDTYQTWLFTRSNHLSIIAGTVSAIRKIIDDGDMPNHPSLERLFARLDAMDADLAPLENAIREEAQDRETIYRAKFVTHPEGSDAELRAMFPRSL